MIGRSEKILLLAASLATGVSGLVYGWMRHFARSQDPFSVVSHPWQPQVAALHILAAPVLVFGLGLITRDHIIGRFRDPRARRGRKTGIVAAALLIPMVASGYVLQALGSQAWRDATGWLHLGLGFLYLLLLAAHLRFSSPGAASPARGAREGAAIPGGRRRLKRR
ncbi:MAG TPA: hypothetical protein VFW45_02985 [Candidatus Polarisedimenticolia bacterium]|nr:hypothetical protein [Candidatus Polarisedimenticolia bacterium]